MSYAISLLIHMRGLGSEGTQIRNNKNLREVQSLLNPESTQSALCYSEEYIFRFMDAKGGAVKSTQAHETRLKDKNWWLPGELAEFKCDDQPANHTQTRSTEPPSEQSSGADPETLQALVDFADKGETKAMVALGALYYSGETGTVDYQQAYEWWNKAYAAGNADGLAHIGMLYLHGKGVEKNLAIAYDIFLKIYMKKMGDFDTHRMNRENIVLAKQQMNQNDMIAALCFSEEYIDRYIDAKGTSVEPTQTHEIRIKDKNWWRKGELPDLKCP